RGVSGRFQVLHKKPLVVVDYAHTPDALERTLSVARSLICTRALTTRRGKSPDVSGRVLCVFGCGGDRDPGKREEMGAVAVFGADEVIITNDNPRHEDPSAIADAVERGARKVLAEKKEKGQQGEGHTHLTRMLDREQAIRRA